MGLVHWAGDRSGRCGIFIGRTSIGCRIRSGMDEMCMAKTGQLILEQVGKMLDIHR